jgi:hypothetical protein
MITLKYSTNNRFSFQVLDDSHSIGSVKINTGLTCDKYLAMIHGEVNEDCRAKEFDTAHDALSWLEKQRVKINGVKDDQGPVIPDGFERQ